MSCSVETYSIGESRSVVVGKNSITLHDNITKKFVNLSFKRWSVLREQVFNIDSAIRKVVTTKEDVLYRHHLGSNFFITVASGVWCVDIRKHYKVTDGNQDDYCINGEFLRPTRMGMGLRFREWRALKEAMTAIDAARQDIADTEPCFHQNQEGK
jgi:hypothetical protein